MSGHSNFQPMHKIQWVTVFSIHTTFEPIVVGVNGVVVKPCDTQSWCGITLLNIQLSFCGPSKYNTGMFEKL